LKKDRFFKPPINAGKGEKYFTKYKPKGKPKQIVYGRAKQK